MFLTGGKLPLDEFLPEGGILFGGGGGGATLPELELPLTDSCNLFGGGGGGATDLLGGGGGGCDLVEECCGLELPLGIGGGRLEAPFTVGSDPGGIGSGLDCIEETGDGPAVADDDLEGGGGRGLLAAGIDGGGTDGGPLEGVGGPGLAVPGTGGGLTDGGFLDDGGGRETASLD